MKVNKQLVINLELQEDEVQSLKEALQKIINVETSISPAVMKILNEKESKILEELFRSIN
ncbi:hypothetical protein OX284_007725 [Flavobacterium sp. SUN046]|uniref:hypothetical protein n=1 Tax=Flavobacterium sp. SUN046 TaxID=3002440 RepID=UPI002DB73903|nr:hypothetical protein [Flavobacterium sp. SUN046]MEC4049316.1 hypothetical protein [Flavobacterium sp. SUN046]